ncbi:hypothetical protein [Aureivirga marina]|uniref:hypothetical protein n=1 Tax=Aureivirga marina TaxID=1182451 RepID=UPI0018C8E024|nr:hypothetical protein [Aureivirga marina]
MELSKRECLKAIGEWRDLTFIYERIQKEFNPNGNFILNEDVCKWISRNNHFHHFHVYFGKHNTDIILIFVPLNENGEERRELEKYMTVKWSLLKKDFVLLEKDVVTNLKKTTFSKDLNVLKYEEETQFSVCSKPNLEERATSKDIANWKIRSMDWFHYEIEKYRGERIFRSFIVPFSDLKLKEKINKEIRVLIGLKYSLLFGMHYPILIFVKSNLNSSIGEFFRKDEEVDSETNSNDFSSPCPPFCKDKIDFKFFE